MQETEIKTNLNHNFLSFPGYTIETETNSMNSRVAAYINTGLQYVRRSDLEGKDCNLMIIDLLCPHNLRVINIYRSFTPQHNVSQRDKFITQLDKISIMKYFECVKPEWAD